MRFVTLILLAFVTPLFAEPFSLSSLDPKKLPTSWRVPRGGPEELLAVLNPQRGDRIDCMAFRADGKLLALSGPDQLLRIADLEKTRFFTPMKQPNPVVCLAFSADGKMLAVGDSEGNVRLIGTEGGLLLKSTIIAHKSMPVWRVEFAGDGKRLITAGRDKSATIWDISKPKAVKLASLAGHEAEVRFFSLSADGEWLATVGNHDKTVRIWDVSSLEKPAELAKLTLPDRVVSVAFAPDGKSLAVGGAKGVAAIYTREVKTWTKAASLETGGHAATSIGYSPDGTKIVGTSGLSSTEDRVLVWNTKGEVEQEFKYGLHLHAAAFAPDGKHLAVITEIETMIVRLK